MARESWVDYFIGLARAAATRATCDRAHVGAVVVRDKAILSTGFNGSARGAPHCDNVGHEMVDHHCVRTVHAEINALVQAAKHGTSIAGANLYVTHCPCYACAKTIVNAGIAQVYFEEAYRIDVRVIQLFSLVGISLYQVDGPSIRSIIFDTDVVDGNSSARA